MFLNEDIALCLCEELHIRKLGFEWIDAKYKQRQNLDVGICEHAHDPLRRRKWDT